MSICSYEGEFALLEVEVHAIHHGAELVVSRCEDCLVDACDEHVYIEENIFALCTDCGHCGVANSACARDRERAACPLNLNLPCSVVNLELEGHLGELLE